MSTPEHAEHGPGAELSSRHALAVAAVALVALVPILIGVLIGSGGTASASRAPFTSAPIKSASPPSSAGTVVALVRQPTTMRVAPAGQPLAQLSTRTEFGSPQALWVVDQASGWLAVISPQAGNGRVGWIPGSVASLTRVDWELKVSLASRRLLVLQDGNTVARYTVAIGQPDAPTPTGRFAVTDRLHTGDPSGPYGCCVLALSAHSPHAIQGWSGGDRIAIHSTPETATIGLPVSHGCVRVTMVAGRWLLAHIPLGTPTLISS